MIETQATHPEHARHEDTDLGAQIDRSFSNFHYRFLNHELGSPDNTPKDREAHKALEHLKELTTRHNIYANLTHSPLFKVEVIDLEEASAGEGVIGEIHCPEPKIAGNQLSSVVNTSESLAGVIRTETRSSDGKIIPKSSALCESLRSPKTTQQGLLEFVYAHFDSINQKKGCAANGEFLQHLEEMPRNFQDLFSDREMGALLNMKPEDANLEHLRRTTVPAITNFYNTAREVAGCPTVPVVAIPALLDTATRGMELRNGAGGRDILSTTELTLDHSVRLNDAGVEEFGAFRHTFTTDRNYLQFRKARAQLTRVIVDDPKGIFVDLDNALDRYIDRNYPSFNTLQIRKFKYMVDYTIADQHLTGLARHDANQEHFYESPNAKFLALSDSDTLFGSDLPDQHFGFTAANPKDGVNQVCTGLKVMDRHNLVMDEPRLLVVNTTVSGQELAQDSKGVRHSKQKLADILRAMMANEELVHKMKSGRVIPNFFCLDRDNGRVLKALDLSPYL